MTGPLLLKNKTKGSLHRNSRRLPWIHHTLVWDNGQNAPQITLTTSMSYDFFCFKHIKKFCSLMSGSPIDVHDDQKRHLWDSCCCQMMCSWVWGRMWDALERVVCYHTLHSWTWGETEVKLLSLPASCDCFPLIEKSNDHIGFQVMASWAFLLWHSLRKSSAVH